MHANHLGIFPTGHLVGTFQLTFLSRKLPLLFLSLPPPLFTSCPFPFHHLQARLPEKSTGRVGINVQTRRFQVCEPRLFPCVLTLWLLGHCPSSARVGHFLEMGSSSPVTMPFKCGFHALDHSPPVLFTPGQVPDTRDRQPLCLGFH